MLGLNVRLGPNSCKKRHRKHIGFIGHSDSIRQYYTKIKCVAAVLQYINLESHVLLIRGRGEGRQIYATLVCFHADAITSLDRDRKSRARKEKIWHPK